MLPDRVSKRDMETTGNRPSLVLNQMGQMLYCRIQIRLVIKGKLIGVEFKAPIFDVRHGHKINPISAEALILATHLCRNRISHRHVFNATQFRYNYSPSKVVRSCTFQRQCSIKWNIGVEKRSLLQK